MNKVFRLAVVTLVASLATVTAEAKIISLGVAGGTNNAHFSIKGYDDAVSNDTGWQAGVTASIKVPFLSLTPELWYTQNKFSVTESSIAGRTCDVKSQSVNMPIVAGFSIIGPLKLEAGPTFTLFDKATATFGSGTPADLNLGGVRTDVGYVAGLKATILSKITVGARYYGQFGGKENDFGSKNTYTIKSYSYSFNVGYKF